MGNMVVVNGHAECRDGENRNGINDAGMLECGYIYVNGENGVGMRKYDGEVYELKQKGGSVFFLFFR